MLLGAGALGWLLGACGASECPAGEVEQDVCTACGVTGACAERASCARTCARHEDCADLDLPCAEGVCQVMCR